MTDRIPHNYRYYTVARVEARYFDGSLANALGLMDWVEGCGPAHVWVRWSEKDGYGLHVDPPDGFLLLAEHFLVRGATGHFFTCHRDEFALQYAPEMPLDTPVGWEATPGGARSFYHSLSFSQQCALAWVNDWERKTVQERSQELARILKARGAH